MVLSEGVHQFQRPANTATPVLLDYACASAAVPSHVKVWLDDALIEHVHLGPSVSHTWWSSNPLLTEAQRPSGKQRVTVEVGASALMRVEWNLEQL